MDTTIHPTLATPTESSDDVARRGALDVALIAIALLPILIAVARAVWNGWMPIGDDALLALRVDDVGGPHHPWLGSWTSASLSLGDDVNNPGAWYAYLLAPFVAVLGPSTGVTIGVGTLNAASVVAIAASARRLGGQLYERWALAAACVLAWSMGSELLYDIWQPHALLLPLLLAMVLLAGVGAGRPWALVPAIAVVSLVVQTHLGHVYILSALTAAAFAGFAVTHRPLDLDRIRTALRSRRVVSFAAVAVVAWLPSLIEQFLVSGRGNLGRLAGALGGGTDRTFGVADATRSVASVYVVPPWWTRSGFADSFTPSLPENSVDGSGEYVLNGLPPLWLSVPVVVALVVLLAFLFVRTRREPVERSAVALSLVAVLSSVAFLSILVIGPIGFAPHHVRWTFPAAAFVHATLAVVASRRFATVGWVKMLPVAVIVVASLANVAYHAQDQGPVADRGFRPSIERVTESLDQLRGVGPVLYDTSAFVSFEPYSGAIMMRLGELGVDFRVDEPGWLRQVGESRRVDGSEVARLVQVQGSGVGDVPGDWCPVVIDDRATTPFGLFLAPIDDASSIACP